MDLSTAAAILITTLNVYQGGVLIAERKNVDTFKECAELANKLNAHQAETIKEPHGTPYVRYTCVFDTLKVQPES